MSIIPSIAREKSKEKVGKDKITAVTNAQMLNIKESLNQEVRIRNEEETISFWETKKPQGKSFHRPANQNPTSINNLFL